MNTPNTTSTSNTTTKDTEREDFERVILQCFAHALDEGLTTENKDEARTLAKTYHAEFIGEGEAPREGTPFFLLAQGFVLGMGEGLRLAEVLDSCAMNNG